MRRAISPKRRNIFVLLISIVLVCYFYKLLNAWTWREATNILLYNPVNLQYVVVHIDLKGAPPKLAYLRSLLPMLKHYGVNALLMEYEDMFPYEGKLANISAKNCYGRAELKDFLRFAFDLGIEVIPLVQTLGHLEYVLKLEEFKHLRENPAYPDSVCPSKAESKDMIMNMLQQVITFHDSVSPLKHIHVGCDEVYIFNECEQCKSKQVANGKLFENHIKYISSIVGVSNRDTTVLIWDDMLRNINPQSWIDIDPFQKVEPVYWDYTQFEKFPYVHIMKYDKKFGNKWAASAFKGADGRMATIPNLRKRLGNHYSWMQKLQTTKVPGKNEFYTFKGIILTGWSRYSHMDPLCELLPVAMPSLILNLKMIKLFESAECCTNNETKKFFSNYLYKNDDNLFCEGNKRIRLTAGYVKEHCHFNGDRLFKKLCEYINVIKESNYLIRMDEISGNEYYLNSKYINKHNAINHIIEYNNILAKIQAVEKEVANNMHPYYEDDDIEEYIGYKTYAIKRKLEYLIKQLQSYIIFNGTWGKRPNY